jgi:molybdopterin-guanine dinucleotide biosynthesis protein A
MDDLTAVILAGGRSRRMGRDKAFVEVGGATLLDRTLRTARELAAHILISGSANKFASFGTVAEDVFPDRGPLAGIHAALAISTTDLNLVLAVDLPLLTAPLLRYLIARARETSALVTVPRIAGGWQPLCAVYRRAFSELAADALRRGHNKIDALFPLTSALPLEEAELTRHGFTPQLFCNLNSPPDLEASGLPPE